MMPRHEPAKSALLWQASSAAVFALTVMLAVGSASRPAPAGNLPPYRSTLDRANPLVGGIYDVRRRTWVEPADLVKAAGAARFVLIGETHDNPDHHALQAWLVREMIAGGHRPAVAFEQISEDRQPVIDELVTPGNGDLSALGPALDWDNSGWPAWPHYAQIASPAVDAGLPMIAANLPRDKMHAVYKDPATAFPADRLARLNLESALPEDISTAILDDVDEGHCGLMEREMLTPMISVQRARDAVMADNLIRGAAMAGSAVLIAGNGHVQADRAVPWHLRRRGESAIVTIALTQVQPDQTNLSDYLADGIGGLRPFAFLWFTPRISDRDHCAELAAHLTAKPDQPAATNN